MKSIQVTVTQAEYEQAVETKGDRNWREAFLEEFDVQNGDSNGA